MDFETQEKHKAVALQTGRESACGKKVNYLSYETALKAAISMNKKIKKELEPYPCPYCGGWHIGRKMVLE